MEQFKKKIRIHFKLEERNTNIENEVRGGIVTFLTMSYILLVNPQILGQLGFPAKDVAVSTALASGTASIICGVVGNLPFGLAPGTGLSAYLTYGLVMAGICTTPQAMTACFIAGLLMGLCAVLKISTVIMRLIPHSIKLATVVGMGLLIALIGMTSVKLVVGNPDTLVTLGDVTDINIILSMIGLVLTGSLLFHQVKGGVLIGIVVITIAVWIIDKTGPSGFIDWPYMTYGVRDNIDFSAMGWDMFMPIMAFLFVGIFDVSGVMFGMASLAEIDDGNGNVPGSLWAFIGSSVGTMIAAMFGCSPIIVHVESAAGIKEGGRTGLTAVVVGLCFYLSLFFAPIFGKVPQTATAPILILVGAMMIGEARHIDWTNMSSAIPAFLTIVMMPFTFSIPNGIAFGLITTIAFFFTTGNFWHFLKDYNLIGSNDGERTHLTGDGHSPSLLDNEPMIRHPSLILAKKDVDDMIERERTHSTNSLNHL